MRRSCVLALLLGLAGASSVQTQASPVAVLGITSEIIAVEQRLESSREVTVRGVVFRQGTLGGRPVVVGRTGTGKVNAAIATSVLIGHFNPGVVLFSGTAGAADPDLELGDVVIGTMMAHHDIGQRTPAGLQRRGPRHAVSGELDPLLLPAPEALIEVAKRATQRLQLPPMMVGNTRRTPRIVEGVIVTGEAFVADPAHREELRQHLKAAAVEMEGAAVVQTCRFFGVPCLVIRSITDRADGQAMSSYQALRATASENAAAVVTAIVSALDQR
ncbi:MAG: 5'-methylthioadenosine/adenosylhomocysteine nucleosidase [Acidobacteriota bacterium]